MKLLIVGSLLAAISATGLVGEHTTRIWHHGRIIEVVDSAKQEHLDHGDELMILYNGHWVPSSIYDAFYEQRASAEVAASLTPSWTRFMSFSEKEEEW